ncbi:MAG: hypothetical protein J0H29_11160 [Sphingobacteriales bacterium]|nr:hypothetical protein [Sphingobacteriales bacterium]OJY90322.1 MAG: hypothetical protein BGP14_11650 [Sphingobacteriales bacterium 44-15]
MKKILSTLFSAVISLANIHAQRCFDMHTAVVTEFNAVPSSAMESFKACTTKPGERSGAKDIVDYGVNYKKIDDYIKQKEAEFTNVTYKSLAAPEAPSSSQVEGAKQLAETLNSMTDDQKKAFAVKMAQQQMQRRSNEPAIQDDGATTALVGKTMQLSLDVNALMKAFTDRLHAISDSADRALQDLKKPDCNCSPADNTGNVSCACVNQQRQPYLKQRVDCIDKYNKQKINVYNEYLPKVKAICAQIDAGINSLKMGDAVKTPNLKKQLFSAQGGAFAAASQLALSEENIRKTGADVYTEYYNSLHGVYDGNCTGCF